MSYDTELTLPAYGRMGLPIEDLPRLYTAWRHRFADRDHRMAVMDEVVAGNFASFDPDEEDVVARSPNFIQVALEDTAEAAALMPTIRVVPNGSSATKKKKASKMERIGAGYMDVADQEALINRTLLDLCAFGFSAWVIWPDTEQKLPLIEKTDPRFVYPEPGYRPGDRVCRVLLAREIFFSQLPLEYQAIMADFIPEGATPWDENIKVTLVEYYDKHELIIAGLYESRGTYPMMGPYGSGADQYTPVEFERIQHNFGVCPVVIGSRFVLDGEFRGQFDQVVDVLEAHVRLTSMVLDYADQAVYSDIWVRDLIGELPYGGGSYIELGPNGAIGRLPPAVTSLSVSEDLDRLTDALHLGSRWPKQRPGEVDQAIASAKFVEATTGVMNTAIKTLHQICRRMMEQALRIAFTVDKKLFPGYKTVSGILRNQEFIEGYNTDDIDLNFRIKVEYGLGLGREPAQSAVLHIQYGQAGYISTETVQENIEGITDVARERARIDVQQLRDMAMAKLLEGLQTGTIPEQALIDIARDRLNGDDIFELYERYIIAPAQELQAQGLPQGMSDQLALPGPPAGPEGAATVPGPAGAPAPTPVPPGAPAPPEILARLGVPAGPGGLLGSQSTGSGSQ